MNLRPVPVRAHRPQSGTAVTRQALLLSFTLIVSTPAGAQESPPPPDLADTLRAVEMSEAVRRAYPPGYGETDRVVDTHYPPALLAASVGGTTLVRLVVDAQGRPLAPRVAESSGNAEFDAAALRVAQEIRFTPAIRNGVPHPVWGYFTVRFRPPGRDWVEGASAEQVRAWADSAQALAPSEVESEPAPINGIGRLVEEAYPAALREAGVHGWLTVWFVVDTRGMPSAVRVARSSGHPELDRAGVQATEKRRFYPARRGGQPVNAWVASYLGFHPPAFTANWLVPGGGYAPPPRTPEVDPATVDTAAVYEPRQLSVPPELLNRSDAARSLAQNYPEALRQHRITGTAVVAAVIGRDGRVEETRVESATYLAFGEAAERVVRTMRFTPGKLGGVSVRVRVMLPVNFSISNEE